MTLQEKIDLVLTRTQPLKHPRGQRLPLFVWALRGVPDGSDEELERILKQLDARGMALLAVWNTGEQMETSLKNALRLARLQKKLGLMVGVDAIRPLYGFFDGSRETAHIDEQGRPFFDDSFHTSRKMGCPFTLDPRIPVIRSGIETFVEAYKQAGLPLHFVFSDWEIDGPIEWNQAWAHSKRCVRCRQHVPNIDDFRAFQAACRKIRSRLQRECYAKPILDRFPEALVGNYAVYPHDGWRYWYDWFEDYNPDLPHKFFQREPARPWYHEFPETDFTFAMPVLYTWYRLFKWYDFKNPDYHWFYNMLKIASNAGSHTPETIPIITFVHHTLTRHPREPEDPAVKPMSEWAYKELLWHALLRGHDTFFLWCPDDQTAHELPLVYEVWSESLTWNRFLLRGAPVVFDVPETEGAVVSAVRLGDELLVRRTDFAPVRGPVTIRVAGQDVQVPPAPGRCRVLHLPQ